jgi:hypothetical protein
LKSLVSVPILASALLMVQPTLAQNPAPNRLVDSMYLTAGLQGVGLGLGKSQSRTLGYRVDFNGGSISDTYNETGTRYQGEIELRSAGAYLDYFPFGGSFRLTTGLAYFGSELALSASGDGTGRPADIGGRPVVLGPTDRIDATVQWPSVAPYIGLGFGHGLSSGSGFYLGIDLGGYIGDFKSTLTVSPSLRAQLGPTGDENIRREREELEDAVGDLGFVPSLQSYIGYRF